MDALYLLLLLIMTRVTFVFLQICRELKVHAVVHQNRTLKFFPGQHVSCIPDLSLEQCALECLLLKACKSFSHAQIKHARRTLMNCELSKMHLNAEDYSRYLEIESGYVYVDIQDWPKEVAGTCAHRPCAENQRCVQTKPHRCITIDCGTPPAGGTNTIVDFTNTALGSHALYMCRDRNKQMIGSSTTAYSFGCPGGSTKLCNSDSHWVGFNHACP